MSWRASGAVALRLPTGTKSLPGLSLRLISCRKRLELSVDYPTCDLTFGHC